MYCKRRPKATPSNGPPHDRKGYVMILSNIDVLVVQIVRELSDYLCVGIIRGLNVETTLLRDGGKHIKVKVVAEHAELEGVPIEHTLYISRSDELAPWTVTYQGETTEVEQQRDGTINVLRRYKPLPV